MAVLPEKINSTGAKENVAAASPMSMYLCDQETRANYIQQIFPAV